MLELDQVAKSYGRGDRRVAVLRDISLSFAEGQTCAIVGPSGSGKSTMLNLIGLLDRPDAGRISIAGQPIDFTSPVVTAAHRNRLLGFVFQAFHLLPRMTAWQNVALPLLYRGVAPGERRRRAIAMLERVGLDDRIDHLPSALSGGQCQRVAIARALVGEPRILLADEPTGALDSTTAAEIMAMLTQLNARLGVLTVIVTHDLTIAERCARRIELLDGDVVADRLAA